MTNDPTSLPDPLGPDALQSPTGDGTAQASSTINSSPSLSDDGDSGALPDPPSPVPAMDPFSQPPMPGPNPFTLPSAPVPSNGPQTGIWLSDQDSQFLIQWSLEEGQDPQLGASNASQAAPPATCKARVRIFQEIFETTLAATRPVVPFSLRDTTTGSVYLQGSLVLLQQPSGPPPMLLVNNLKFAGFQQAQVVLFPSAPDISGGESGG